MMYLRQSTAVTKKLGPFLDETDGKTTEEALTISQADIRLSKNGGLYAQTNNVAGATHDENGWYGVPLDTTDTGTLGSLTVAIHESGALPVWKEYMVVPAAVYDSMVLGTDVLPADVTQIGGDAQSATDLKDFADAGYDPGTNKVQGVVLCDTATTVTGGATAAALATAQTDLDTITGSDGVTLATAQGLYAPNKVVPDAAGTAAGLHATTDAAIADVPTVAEFNARTLVAASYFDPSADTVAHVTLVDTTTTNTDMVAAAPTAAANADAVWDETLADHLGAGSCGNALNAAGAAGDPWSTALPGAYGAGTAGKIVGDNIDAPVSGANTVVPDAAGTAAALHATTDALIGTPVALDGGAATVGGMLTKMADDNGGADFDAETDSLTEQRNNHPARFAVLGIEPGGFITQVQTTLALAGHTPQTGDNFARIGAAGAGLTNINLPNQTMDIVGNITGNLSGSVGSVTGAVGSVTGAVGSVTGAVGSVTGNVGGNVVGTVASVVGAVGSVAGNVDGNVTGSVGSVVGDTKQTADHTAAIAAIPTAVENADGLLARNVAGGSNGGRTVKQALYRLRNKSSLVAGTLTVCDVADAGDWTAAVTTDPAADLITVVDPT